MTVAAEFGARGDAEGPLLAAAFRLLLAQGRPVSVERLAAALGRDAEPVEQALDRLARARRTRRNQAGRSPAASASRSNPPPTS
jgi:predicted transcriptional regulator